MRTLFLSFQTTLWNVWKYLANLRDGMNVLLVEGPGRGEFCTVEMWLLQTGGIVLGVPGF